MPMLNSDCYYMKNKSFCGARRGKIPLAVLGVLLPLLANAQVPPPSVAPTGGQIEKQFVPEPQPRAMTGVIEIPAQVEAPPKGLEDIKFVLRQVDIVGATVFSQESLKDFYQPLVGQQVGLSDLYAVARRITVHYRNAGYVLSQAVVPAQSIDDGRVRLQVIEGYVADYQVRGIDTAQYPLIEVFARKITEHRPADAATLERYLLLMNDQGGVTVRGTLLPAKEQPGASTLVLDVTRQTWAGGASVDNRGGKAFGYWRTSMDVQGASLLTPHDRTSLKAVTTWDRRLNYVALGHEQAVGQEGGRLGLTYSAVRSEPEEHFFIPLNQESQSDSVTLNYSYPLIRTRTQNLGLRASLGSHDGKTKLFKVVETEDRIRSARLGLTWDYADALGGVNLADIEYSQGISGLGSSHNGDPLLSRAGGRVDYRKVNLYAARVQTLSPRWSLLAAVSGQYAMTDLLASELFSIGGEHFGRAYDPSEAVGDHGLAGKIELRYGIRQPVASVDSIMLYGFYDDSSVRQRSPQPGSASKEYLQSGGFGMRFHVTPALSGFVEGAKPINRNVASEGNRDSRIYGGISARF